MLPQTINDVSDARVAIYRNLKDKDLARSGAFIVEGKFILETLLTRSRFQIRSIFVSEDRLLPLEPVFKFLTPETPLYVTSAAIMAEIAGFNVHRGVLAAGNVKLPQHQADLQIANMHRIAVLSNISNPDNIGAIFRNAAGLGVEAIILDQQCCSPLYRKAIRVSMGATLVLPWQQNAGIEAIAAMLQTNGFTNYALALGAKTELSGMIFANKSAFFFGEEAYGLSTAVLSQCEGVKITMENGTDSLNVAASSAIVFEAVRRQKRRAHS